MARRGGERVPGRADNVCKDHVLQGENSEQEEGPTCVKHRERRVWFREEERKWVDTRLKQANDITSQFCLHVESH